MKPFPRVTVKGGALFSHADATTFALPIANKADPPTDIINKNLTNDGTGGRRHPMMGTLPPRAYLFKCFSTNLAYFDRN
jgi:hypothetical protein